MKVGERKEYIELERSEIKFAKQRKAGSRYVARAKSRKKQGVPEEYREKGFERTGQRILISKEFKKNLIENNLSKVLQDAKAVPSVNSDGELNGFKLTNIKSDSIYEKAGLVNNDIIREINGVSLRDAGQAISLLNSLRGESDIEVKLDRGGSTMTLNMQVQ